MNHIAIVLLASLLSSSPEGALDRAQLTQQAASGDRDAIHTMCYAQLYGSGLPKNYGDAFLWCEKGANLGIPSSQTLLAEMYHFGYHVQKNDAEARHWYTAAAEKGHKHAQFVLGRLIFANAKTTDEVQEACRWFITAADAGYQKAKEQLVELDESWSKYYAGKPPRAHFCVRQDGA